MACSGSQALGSGGDSGGSGKWKFAAIKTIPLEAALRRGGTITKCRSGDLDALTDLGVGLLALRSAMIHQDWPAVSPRC